jgi:hypothetical protein
MNGEIRDKEKVTRGLKENGYAYFAGLSTLSQLF